MSLQKQSKELKQKKLVVRLPYLQKIDKPNSKSKNQKSKLVKNFDLSTSNGKLPKYNPQSDRNLRMFFQKPLNKKLIQRLKQLKSTSTNSKNKTKQSRVANSQHLFQNYLNKKQKNDIMKEQRKEVNKSQKQQKRNFNKSENISRKRISTVTSHEFLSYLQNVRKKIMSNQLVDDKVNNVSS